jgi:hypothetical protein
LLAVVLALKGWYLKRRFGAAIHYDGIGRPYPLWQSGLALLGYALMIIGVVLGLIAVMLLSV